MIRISDRHLASGSKASIFALSKTMFHLTLSCLVLLPGASTIMAETSSGKNGAVATVHPLATQEALRVMQSGGNAIDAAVAAALMLGVVDGHNSGIGGGCFILIRTAAGKFAAIDGRETAPMRSSRAMYLKSGALDLTLSQTGPLAVGTPGALAAYDLALNQFGTKKLSELILPAAAVAENGFKMSASYAARLTANNQELAKFPASASIFARPESSPAQAGEALVQKDLAATYRSIANSGASWFYRGEFARRVGDWMSANGGLLDREDFARYTAKFREPIITRYRGVEIVGFPPPSSGGVHVAQILNILENFELKPHGFGTDEDVHLIVESMKLAFADRAYWLGDPDFSSVPRGLVSKSYGTRLAKKIDRNIATPVAKHSVPPQSAESFFERHTTHFTTADKEGNWVACTATINTSFGSKVVVPGTGVLLNNEMDDFAIQPGTPNFFGLVGAEANAIEPGKRPLSSMSPAIVLKNKEPILTCGAAGGPTIISQTLLTLVGVLDYGLSLEEALNQPRFHHQWKPDQVRLEKSGGAELRNQLEKRGHSILSITNFGATQAISRSPATGVFTSGSDPRVETGSALGF